MGVTWGPLISLVSQVGVIHLPQLIQVGPALALLGRETLGIPGVQPPYTVGYPRQLVAFVSYDNGQTFQYGTVLDTYTGRLFDGGYCWPMQLSNGQLFVVYYADSHNLQLPDIKFSIEHSQTCYIPQQRPSRGHATSVGCSNASPERELKPVLP
jgi:hypothetical protein